MSTISTSDLKQCAYVPGKPGIIDAIHPVTGRGVYSNETIEQIATRYPGAIIGDFDAVVAAQNAYWIRAPKPITSERWQEMLEVLPPVDWRGDSSGECESFKLCERTSGNVTAIFCRVGGRYFELQNDIRTPHARIVELCRAA